MIRLVAITWLLAGCATLQARTVDSTTFALQLRNVGDRTVTFTKMDRTVYRPGTESGSTGHAGRWQLRPGGEWKVSFSSHLTIDVVLPPQAEGRTPIVR
ncbi:MAG TPA: hypothetical protein VFV05_24280 [Methylomirabilota bacterium]|nr:hypothetical protein [Methylomirabilota bacterium]